MPTPTPMSNSLQLLVLPFLAASCVAPVRATLPPEQPAPAERPWDSIEEGHDGGHAEGHGAGSQALNAFVGSTTEVGNHDGLTLGLDYEYRLSHKWGIGGFAEGISGHHRSFAVGAQAYWHVAGDLVLVAGPGAERHEDEWEPIVRVGGFYEFLLGGGWVLSPAVFYDITPGDDIFIFGFNIGYIW